MRNSLLILVVSVLVAASASLRPADAYRIAWLVYKLEYGKVYTPEEERTRFPVFCDNLDFIYSHNLANMSYSLQMNEFGDLSWSEFKGAYLAPASTTSHTKHLPLLKRAHRMKPPHQQHLPRDGPPTEVDWVKKGVVSDVVSQGRCGSCYAFSSISSVEALVAMKTGKLFTLAPQEILECSRPQGNEGCGGGVIDQAFDYILARGGLCQESAYPYTAHDGKCQLPEKCTALPQSAIQGYIDVLAQGNETELMVASAQTVVSLAVEASPQFQFYSKGVFSGPCGDQINHGMSLVGYGQEGSGQKFWKLKNTWSKRWGEDGYIRLLRGPGTPYPGTCGILAAPSYAY